MLFTWLFIRSVIARSAPFACSAVIDVVALVGKALSAAADSCYKDNRSPLDWIKQGNAVNRSDRFSAGCLMQGLTHEMEMHMYAYVRNFLTLLVARSAVTNRQAGATLIEYALIVAVIAVAVLVAGITISGDITNIFGKASSALNNA